MLPHAVIMAENLLGWEERSEAVYHVESFDHSGETWRFLGVRELDAVNVVDDTVHVPSNQTSIQSVQKKLWDCFREVVFSLGLRSTICTS